MTQTERVLAAARSFRGVTQVDFLAPEVIDGGKPITRVAARIDELRNRGYTFEIVGRRSKCVAYRVLSEPEDAESGSGERSPSDGRLSRSHSLPPAEPAAVALSAQGQLFAPTPASHYRSEAA